MATLLLPQASKKKTFGDQILAGMNAAEPGIQQFLAGQEAFKKGQQENEAIKRQTGLDLSGIKDPNTRSTLIADQLTRGKALEASKASNAVKYDPYSKEGVSLNKPGKEPVTTGVPGANKPNVPRVQPVKSEKEIIDEAHSIVEQKQAQGIPADFNSEYNTLNTMKGNVEADNAKIKNTQDQIGQVYEDKLERLFPGASDDLKAWSKRKGEESYEKGKTPAEVETEASAEARVLKNRFHKLEEGIKPLTAARDWSKAKKDIQIKIQPLLDEGLSREVRTTLNSLGLYPEQVEDVMSNIGEHALREIADIPKLERPERTLKNWWDSQKFDMDVLGDPLGKKQVSNAVKRTPEQYEILKEKIGNVFKADPNVNTILLREKLKNEKDIDWDEYKDIVNDLILEKKIKLNPDQENRMNDLEQPPLSGLGKFLKNIRLSG